MIAEGTADFEVREGRGLVRGRVEVALPTSYDECLEEVEIRVIEMMVRKVQRRLQTRGWVELLNVDVVRL